MIQIPFLVTHLSADGAPLKGGMLQWVFVFIQGLSSVSGSAAGEAAELMHVIPLQLNLSQQEGSSHMRRNHFPRSRLTSQLLEISHGNKWLQTVRSCSATFKGLYQCIYDLQLINNTKTIASNDFEDVTGHLFFCFCVLALRGGRLYSLCQKQRDLSPQIVISRDGCDLNDDHPKMFLWIQTRNWTTADRVSVIIFGYFVLAHPPGGLLLLLYMKQLEALPSHPHHPIPPSSWQPSHMS